MARDFRCRQAGRRLHQEVPGRPDSAAGELPDPAAPVAPGNPQGQGESRPRVLGEPWAWSRPPLLGVTVPPATAGLPFQLRGPGPLAAVVPFSRVLQRVVSLESSDTSRGLEGVHRLFRD